jgi:hypothetical protein
MSNIEAATTFLSCFFIPVYVKIKSLYFYVNDIRYFTGS